jgi:hypothetical protein
MYDPCGSLSTARHSVSLSDRQRQAEKVALLDGLAKCPLASMNQAWNLPKRFGAAIICVTVPLIRSLRRRWTWPRKQDEQKRKSVLSCWFSVLSCSSWAKSWWHSRFPAFPQRTRKEWGTSSLYLIQILTWNGQAARREDQGTSRLSLPRFWPGLSQGPRPLAKNARRTGHPLFCTGKVWACSRGIKMVQQQSV